MLDKRDKLTSRLFKAKLEQLLSAIDQYNPLTGIPYTTEIHSFIWRKQANSELSKSYLLSKENVKLNDICFTVDVYKFNN